MGIFNAPMGLGMKGAGGGIGRALTGPQIPVQSAPVDPSQISKWQAFRQKLASDPNLRMALLTAGVNMMRTPEMGQTGFDVFADAAGTGIGTLDQLRQRDKSERNEASDRQFTRESTGRQLDQGDRRIEQGDEQNEIARKGVNQRSASDSMGYAIRLRELAAERERRADGTSAELTGQERVLNRFIRALRKSDPEKFPDDDAAFLFIQDQKNEENLGLEINKLISERAMQLQIWNEMPIAEATALAREEVTRDLRENAPPSYYKPPVTQGPVTGTPTSAPVPGPNAVKADPTETGAVMHPIHGVGRYEKNPDGTYTFLFKSGMKTVDEAEGRAMVGQHGTR